MKIMTFKQVGKGRIELTEESQYGEYKIIRHTGVRPQFQLIENRTFKDMFTAFEYIREPVESSESICIIYEYTDLENKYFFALFKTFKNPQTENLVEFMQKSPSFVAMIYLPNNSLILAGDIPNDKEFFVSLRDVLSEELELNYDLEI